MKRTPCLIALVASLGHPGSAPAGPDRCAVPAADPVEPSSVDASLAMFAACVDEAPPPEAERDVERTWARMKQCNQAARTIVLEGTDADREWLWSRFDERSDEPWIVGSILDVSLDRQLERTLAALEGSAPAPREPAAADVEMPDFLRDAPAELQQAWQTYQAVIQAQEEADDSPSRGAEIPFASNQAGFRRAVAGLLQGRVPAADAVRELSRYQWDGGCVMGRGLLDVPRAKALVIAHLQGGRADLALAASGGIGASPFGFEEPTVRWDRRLLAASGVDWEQLYLGGALSGVTEMADTLARQGSERAGRHLLAAAQVMETDAEHESKALLWPLAALVESSGPCGDYRTDPTEVQRNCGAEPISGELQRDILDRLAEKAGPDAGLGEAGVASHLLVRLCRAESRPAFRAMLRSRYEQVRERGAIGLRAHGETFAAPRPSRPVAFRLLVDGKPAVQQKVEWMLEPADQEYEWSSGKTDDQGIVRLGRDPFVDPRHRLTSMRLAAPDLASPADVWFAATVDPPADLDAVSTVTVRTGSLTVVIPPSLLAGGRQGPPTLQVIARVARDGSDDLSLQAGTNLPVTSTRITFPHLQHGGYDVWLYRKRGLHLSATVEVGEQPATLAVNEHSVYEEPEEN